VYQKIRGWQGKYERCFEATPIRVVAGWQKRSIKAQYYVNIEALDFLSLRQ
jgi:hypothetical protein